eukprot:819987-Rhodomonas_salina.4
MLLRRRYRRRSKEFSPARYRPVALAIRCPGLACCVRLQCNCRSEDLRACYAVSDDGIALASSRLCQKKTSALKPRTLGMAKRWRKKTWSQRTTPPSEMRTFGRLWYHNSDAPTLFLCHARYRLPAPYAVRGAEMSACWYQEEVPYVAKGMWRFLFPLHLYITLIKECSAAAKDAAQVRPCCSRDVDRCAVRNPPRIHLPALSHAVSSVTPRHAMSLLFLSIPALSTQTLLHKHPTASDESGPAVWRSARHASSGIGL